MNAQLPSRLTKNKIDFLLYLNLQVYNAVFFIFYLQLSTSFLFVFDQFVLIQIHLWFIHVVKCCYFLFPLSSLLCCFVSQGNHLSHFFQLFNFVKGGFYIKIRLLYSIGFVSFYFVSLSKQHLSLLLCTVGQNRKVNRHKYTKRYVFVLFSFLFI